MAEKVFMIFPDYWFVPVIRLAKACARPCKSCGRRGGGRVLLSSSAGMTEKPSIILARVASAQAKTEVFVKIDRQSPCFWVAQCTWSTNGLCSGEKKPKLLSLGLNPPKEEGGGDTWRSTEGTAGGAEGLAGGFAFALWRAVCAVVQ
ncbi:hypothetical protein CBM2637_A70048 [Cupriavidus taiwanensis]|nr:hypothetical protein CBM2637_A70048 [Cupriavidus taiwanensis]